MDSRAVYGALARHILTGLGGVLVGRDMIDATQVEPLVGAVLLIAGVVWSIAEKQRAAKR